MIPQYELELNEPQSERSVEQQNFIIHDTTPSESLKMAVPDYQLKKTTYQEPVKRRTSPSPKKKKKKKQYTTTQALKLA
jgi:predicted SAM-dependent methyltransferase